MKKLFLLLLFSFFLFHFSSAQKEANIWCFGANAGLDFNSGAPVAYNGVAMNQLEGCSSIADANGVLLFYTDGMYVWNKNNLQMPNGFGLYGAGSSTQSAMIIKLPGSVNIYYIFTTADFLGVNGFNYSIVDMNLNGGLGDVTIKNTNILPLVDERVTAARHANGNDMWVITSVASTDTIKSYLLTGAGLNPVPVSTYTGSAHPGAFNYVGYLKASPRGDRLAVGYQTQGYEVYDFDNATGIISNPIVMQGAMYSAGYGVEFSPDETRLYCSNVVGPTNVYQFDLTAGSAAAIAASVVLLATSTANNLGSLQLAPDGKIYLARWGSPYLAVINDPNQLGLACNYNDTGYLLPNGSSQIGLPNFFPGFFSFPLAPPVVNFIASDRHICPGTCISFTNFSAGATSYQWYFPGAVPDTSTDASPQFICYNTSGNYPVTLVATNAAGIDSVTLPNLIEVFPLPPVPSITQVIDTLFATGGYASYQWFFVSDTIAGATDSFYVATQNGNYNLVVTDANGCAVGGGILNVVIEGNGVKEFGVGGLGFEVYPNPARDMLYVTCYTLYGGDVSFEIYNSLGEKVFSNNYELRTINNDLKINTADFSGGIYLLKITSGGKMFTEKIVVNK